jgi:hypothetical protein
VTKKIEYVNNCTDRETGSRVSVDISVSPHLVQNAIQELEKLVCQAKETLRALEVKPKTWDQKVENPVVQQEHVSSTPNNDQKSQEKEQSQKIVKTSDILKQYLVSYGSGLDTEAVESLMEELDKGNSVYYPDTITVQVIDL